MDEELKNRIIADIYKTGFPAELKIANQLKEQDWRVEQNSTYVDHELQKSREIDIISRKSFFYEMNELKIYFTINLIIEIKKSSKRPWIIFTRPYYQKSHHRFQGPGYGQIYNSENFSTGYLNASSLMRDFPRNSLLVIGTSYYEAFKSPDEISKIYEAILVSIKAAFDKEIKDRGEDNEYETSRNKGSNEREVKLEELQILDIYMPIIILEGLLCSATLNEKDEIEINEIEYIPIETSYSTKPYDDYSTYYPELMTIKYFGTFLREINRWGDSVINLWKKQYQ